MASSGQKALSGAASGAGLGFQIGGPIGAALGGIGGGILGLFSGSDPKIVAPTFADIDLAKENPELYGRLQQQDALIKQAQSLYDQRRQSITPNEDRMYRDYLAQNGRNLQGSGLAGTSDGMALANNAARTYQDQLADRIYKEKLGLFDNLQNTSVRGYDMNRQALGDVMQTKNAQMGVNENYLNNSNQMWSGLFNGGLSALGQGINTANLRGVPQLPQTYGPLPPGYSYGVPGMGSTGVSGPYSPNGYGTGMFP